MPYDLDFVDPQQLAFRRDVVLGLGRQQKAISPRWLYDVRGSELFEAITLVAEYYPTRTETNILVDNAASIAEFCGPEAVMLEYGAGAGIKTEIVVEALQSPRLYVPIDIAANFLQQTVARLQKRFADLAVVAVADDFTTPIELPATIPTARRFGFFPGSTIGNLDPQEAVAFLRQVRDHVGFAGRLIVGVDLKKDVQTLIDAYDDSRGITAAFNLNLLTRINRELDGTFRLDRFCHRAIWNADESAVEMHLESTIQQTGYVADQAFTFAAGETIHTESSRKYDYGSFIRLAAEASWRVDRGWMDDEKKFAVFGLA